MEEELSMANFKKYAPLFENLHENKMIYQERGIGYLIRAKNIEITPQGFSAKAVKICELYNRFEITHICQWYKEWNFGASWDNMNWSGNRSFGVPYVTFRVWIDAELINWEYKLKQYSEKVEKGLVKAKIGYLKHKNKSCSNVFGYCKPCLVVTQRGKLADTVSVIEIEIKEGQIVKINVGDVPKKDDRNRLIENPFSD